MRIIFDKRTEKERELELDFFNESIVGIRANGYLNRPLAPGVVIPDLSGFAERFETVEVVASSGMEVPVQGSYDTILELGTHFDDKSGIWGVNLTLGVAPNA